MSRERHSIAMGRTAIAAAALALTFAGFSTCRADEPPPADAARLTVATKESPPFAFKRADGSWTGISIELWRRTADELGVEYDFEEVELAEIFDRLEAGEADAAIAAISITAERDRRIAFSHAYHTTGLGIAVSRNRSGGVWDVVRGMMTSRFAKILGGLLLFAALAGVLFWWLERRRNEGMFGGRAREGVNMGLWWSTIILLGHKGVIPATGVARGVAVTLMIASTIAVSALTGVVASAMTISQLGTTIDQPADLRHLRTATVAASTSAEYLAGRRIRYREYPTLDAALEALAEGDADAVVYDVGMLKYRRNKDFAESVEVLPLTFNIQHYAIALRPGSELRKPLNQAILTITSSDDWSDVIYRYLGE